VVSVSETQLGAQLPIAGRSTSTDLFTLAKIAFSIVQESPPQTALGEEGRSGIALSQFRNFALCSR